MTVAEFYERLMSALREMDLEVKISTTPNEVEDATPFPQDRKHASYDPEYANRFWRVLLQTRSRLQGVSLAFHRQMQPGAFLLGQLRPRGHAILRTDGAAASGGVPHLPNAVAQEAYSHEVSSCGFWPGNEAMPEPIFYSYAYPAPEGFAEAKVQPTAANWNTTLREFVLPYDAVRTADAPNETLISFLQSTYEAAARLGKWDRHALEHEGSVAAGQSLSRLQLPLHLQCDQARRTDRNQAID